MVAGPQFDLGNHLRQVRAFVLASMGRRITDSGEDLDDVLQEVYLRLLEAQRSPGSCWRPDGGLSLSSYLFMVARSAAQNALRRPRRVRGAEALQEEEPEGVLEASEGNAWARVFDLLDCDEEREMAAHLAAGLPLRQIRREMHITEAHAQELRTRVLFMLLPLKEGG